MTVSDRVGARAMSVMGGGLFFVYDIEGKLLLKSPALRTFVGAPLDEIDETSWPSLVHPDDRDYARAFFSAAASSLRSFAGWWRLRRHDGVHVWTMITGAPMSSQLSGDPVGYMGTVDPLTHVDAFPRAGGLVAPETALDTDAPPTLVSRLERVADLTLLAAALAREIDDRGINEALDAALMKIGFSLAALTEPSSHPPASVVLAPSYRRTSRQARTERRRLVARG